jgi:hypothetical protein
MTKSKEINIANAEDKITKMSQNNAKHIIPEIKMPSDEVWREEFKGFNFSESQEKELKIVIQHIAEDIQSYNALKKQRGPRAELKRRLLRFEKSLATTRLLIEQFEAGMEHWMPADALEQIGLMSNFLVAEEIHGGKVYSTRVNREIEKASSNCAPLTIDQIGEKLDVSLRSIGLQSGPKILKHFIQKIHEPLRTWVEMEKLNKGGAPAQLTVHWVVYWLAWSAPEILGSEAAVSKDGPFVRLCSAVLRACGCPYDGFGGMAPEIVKKALADRAKHQEEMADKAITLSTIH